MPLFVSVRERQQKEQIMGYVLKGFFFLIGLAVCVGLFGWPATVILFIIGAMVSAGEGK